MKKILLLLLPLFLFTWNTALSQCTPVDCSASLPAYGGICTDVIPEGTVNVPYNESVSFVVTDNCFNAQLIDPGQPNLDVKITNIDNFTFADLPLGLTAGTDMPSYSPPSGSYTVGCAAFNGTPSQIGVFNVSIDFLGDIVLCSFPVNQDDNPVGYEVALTIRPDASFSGLATSYCTTDALVTLTATGTTGGAFAGPGVSGNTFDPATAGTGTHAITYIVSGQEGAAIAPAADTMEVMVTVASSAIYYLDADNDGFGNPDMTTTGCGGPPMGYVSNADDCNDNNANVNPNGTEVCNNKDDDCDGNIDNGLPMNTFYADTDNDGFGDPNNSIMDCEATPPMGYVANADDCDDTNNEIYLGAPEICDGFDNNCDNNVDEGLPMNTFYADLDQDTYGDANNSISTCFAQPPAGYISDPSDCDDTNPDINPGATEACDGIDNNCDNDIDEGLDENIYYADTDNDGFGDNANSITDCNATPPMGYVTDNTDCDDTNPDINPNATEACDGIDNNCDNNVDEGLDENIYYADTDNDGFGDNANSITDCSASAPMGYVTDNTDCDDTNDMIFPGATETPDNGVDEDCDGSDLSTSTEDLATAFGISIAPNPTSGIIYLENAGGLEVRMEVFNLIGKKLIMENTILSNQHLVDLSHFASGIYFLRITDVENKSGIQKIIVE